MSNILVPKVTVESYLNKVSYLPIPGYIPSDFALEFVNFIKMVNGGKGEENLTPLLHYYMLDQIGSNEDRITNMVFRGGAKTSVFGEYFFLYLGVYGRIPGFGKVDLALYVSDSIENGVKNMRKNLEFRWEESAFLQEYIPTIRFTDIRYEFHNADGNVFIVKAYGAKTGVRGSKERGKRPQLAVLDDLLSDDDARSATVIKSVEDTIYKAVDYALHPAKSKVIWSGTPFNARDPLYKAVESGAWAVNVYPVCEHFPCTEAEFRSAWPDRFNYAYVKKKYDDAVKLGKIDTFNQELMLRIMSDEDRLIDDTDINWYDRRTILKNPRAYNFYITTDFAVNETAANDFSVISVWALNYQGYWFWVDGICKKHLMNKNIDALFRLVQKWRPITVGIEVSGQQGGFVSWIQSEMGDRNCYFNIASEDNKGKPGIRPNTNKMVRFQGVVPWFKQGLMFFPIDLKEGPEMQECMDELTLASPGGFKSKHDDFIDTISMLGMMPTFRPSNDMPLVQDTDGIWEPEEEDNLTSALESYVV